MTKFVDLDANGYKLHHLWTGKKLFVAGRGGLGADFRLNNHIAINLEVNANMLSDKFNSKQGRNADWQFNALAGLAFTFGRTKRQAPVYYEQEQPTVTTVVEQPASAPIVEQPQPKEEKIAKEPLKQNVFFALNSARIQTDQQSKIAALVEYMEKNPAAKVNVTGYADKETGNPVINLKLSEGSCKECCRSIEGKRYFI